MKKYIAIDIGGTNIKYGIIDENATLVENYEKPSNANLGGEHLIGVVTQICENFLQKHDIEGVAISTAGMVDTVKGEIIYSGKQIPSYIGVNWKKIIKEKFSLNAEVENDVNCAGLSEAILGAGKDFKSVVCITIGTGIGACMVEDKKVFHGSSNSGFEVGYMILGEGMYQDIASTTALVKNVAEKLHINKNEIDGRMIFDRAKAGDKICNSEIDRLMDNIAIGISNICYVVNPQIVVLGGGIMEQSEFLEPKLNNSLKKYMLEEIRQKTQFAFAKNKNTAGMIGAYYHYVQATAKKHTEI